MFMSGMLATPTSPEQLARGAKLFRSNCVECHADEEGRLRGRTLDYPGFLGWFHSANLTRDGAAGIGGASDAQLARMIKTGVRRDGHLGSMPDFRTLGDDDVAALVGFLRSDDPLLAPDPTPAPPSRPNLVFKAVMVYLRGEPARLTTGVPSPRAAPNADYGRYLAVNLMCAECHTDGFSLGKLDGPGLFAGGMEEQNPAGQTIYSRNLTPDETGLGRWSLADFSRALRDGVTPDRRILRPPMTRFRALDDVDVAALWAYLGTLPRVRRPNREGTMPVARAGDGGDPEAMWRSLGCEACHGDGAPHRDRIRQCIGKPIDEVVRWILDPQVTRPGTQMPTFAGLIDDAHAQALARWVQQRATALASGPSR
jgi:mono/diheme cytochrome c family protein